MKQIRLLLLAVFMAAVTSLNTEEVKYFTEGVTPSVEPNRIVFDQEGHATLYFWIDTEVATLNTFQLDLHLPQGYTIAKNARGKYIVKFTDDEDVIYDHGVSIGDDFVTGEDPFYRFLCNSPNINYIGTGHNMILYAELQAPEIETAAENDDPGEVLEGRINGMVFSADGGWTGYTPPEITFTIVPRDLETSVETVGLTTENSSPEEIYNLQGIRLSDRPATPGIYIVRRGNDIRKTVNK